MTLTELFTQIADAIRAKKNTTDTIVASDFPAEISTIQAGSSESKLPQVVDKTVTTLTEEDLDGATNIGKSLFSDCTSLTSVFIPNSVKSIDSFAFNHCIGLIRVDISNIEAWLNITFANQSANPLNYASNLYLNNELVTDLVVPANVSEIKKYAFYQYSSLTSITISASVTNIGSSAFQNCNNLTGSLIIPASVTSIDVGAFYGCNKLNYVIYEGQTPNINNNQFYNCSSIVKYDFRNCTTVPTLYNTNSLGHKSGCQIIIPDVLYDEWTQATNWVSLTNVVWVKASEV